MNHKRRFFVILLLLCLAVHVHASVPSTETRDVMATYQDVTDTVYRVDITWGNLAFTYEENKGTWNPDTGTYTGAVGKWVVDDEDGNKITVTNRSNADITANLTFTGNGVTADFYDEAAADTKTVLPQTLGTSDSLNTYLCVTGGVISADQKIGSVTLTIGLPEGTESAADETVTAEPTTNTYALKLGANFTRELSAVTTTFTYTPAQNEEAAMTIDDTHTCYESGTGLMLAADAVIQNAYPVKTFQLNAGTTYTFTVTLSENEDGSLEGGTVTVLPVN